MHSTYSRANDSPCSPRLLPTVTGLLAGLALGPVAARAGVSIGPGAPIVEVQQVATLETYACSTCSPEDLDAATLPPGFVRVPHRRTLTDYAVAGKVPTDAHVVTIDVDGLAFDRVARVRDGIAGVEVVGSGAIANLESDRTFRFDAGREVHEIFDGIHRYVLFATGETSDLATLPLPGGWSRSTRTLERDLVVGDPSGFPYVYVDVQQNLWQRLTVTPETRVPEPWRVAGTRLLLVDHQGAPAKRRLKIVLRAGPLPSPGGVDDPTVSGAWVLLQNPVSGEADSIALPATAWQGLGTPAGSKGWRYRDRGRRHGPCRKVSVGPGRTIRILCRGEDLNVSLDGPAQGSLAVGLALGPTITYCAELGGIRRDTSPTSGRGRRRFVAKRADPPALCPFPPIYRLPTRWAPGTALVAAMQVRGRERDAPIVGDIAAMNINAVVDPEADRAYSTAVFPLLEATGAALLVSAEAPTFVDATGGPADWAQPHLALPHYPGARGFLGMTTSEPFGPLLVLKQQQVGDTLRFGFQHCLHECANLVGSLLPVRITGRLLALHFTASRGNIERAVPRLAAEAAGTPGLRLGWVGRTIADVEVVLRTGQAFTSGTPLTADGSLVYVLDPGLEPADVLALPEVTALLAQTGEHVVTFFGP
jgi:hypothetical protein